MPKDIFSKIIKDYNNELEIILEKKAFSSDVKNLLLSMLYKIENAYEDYKKVKVNVCSKKQFVQEILETIEKRCNNIEIIKPTSEEGQKLYEENINCIIDKEEGKIKTFQNEKSILEAIMQMRQEEIEILPKYEIISTPIKETLLIGNKENSLELITNFNGWSWDITKLEFEKAVYNKLYQILIILIGNKGIENWINNRTAEDELEEIPSNVILSSKYNESFGITKEEIQGEKIDHIERIKNKFIENYGEELTKSFFKEFIKVAILNTANHNKEYKEKIRERILSLKEELKNMSDNKIFIENLSSQKREITKQIKEIDTILNDEIKLRKEYEKRNKKLPNKEKIFSTSHLKLMLEKQRNKKLEQIKEINTKMEPQEYVQIKRKLEEELNYYEEINIEESTKENLLRLHEKLEKIFLQCFAKKIEKSKEKNEIENLIYELRYYKQIKPIPPLEKEIEELENKLTRKSMHRKNTNKIHWSRKNKQPNTKKHIWNKNNRPRHHSIHPKIHKRNPNPKHIRRKHPRRNKTNRNNRKNRVKCKAKQKNKNMAITIPKRKRP